MEDNRLFEEFPPVSTEKWEEVIVKDLKGADYEKKLVWKTLEGFNVKPYYRAEDLNELEYLNTNPAQFPFVRGMQADGNVWDIRQDIEEKDLEKANAIALNALQCGANALGLNVSEVQTVDDMKLLLRDVNPECIKIHLFSTQDYRRVLELFVEAVKQAGYDPKRCAGSVCFDPNRDALLMGRYSRSVDDEVRYEVELVRYAERELPLFRVLTIGGELLHNAGSNLTEELGFTLAAANDVLARLTDAGLSVDQVASQVVFSFATGSNYFMEIAKIRAARLLWARIVEQYHPDSVAECRVFIQATTCRWNLSVYDAYVNMLRTTTETMSAAIAGADSITVVAFDRPYKESDEFGSRIARNQQILLKEESYLDKIVDPAAGSYYIENLTDKLAGQAWQLFLEVEEKAGFRKAVEQGFVQERVDATARKRDMDIATRRTTILGTNQYPNLNERVREKLQSNVLEKYVPMSEAQFAVLRQYRGSEAFEELRLATEGSGMRPKVFLLTYGNLAMRKARSGFATNFFGVAGYEIIDNAGFATAAEGVQAALVADADIVVMCSSDDEYAEIAQEVCQGLKGRVKSIVLAGYPKEQVETYREMGVDEFIHIKTNTLECLREFQHLMGIM